MELKFYKAKQDTEIIKAIECDEAGNKVRVFAVIVNARHAYDINLVFVSGGIPSADKWLVISNEDPEQIIEFPSKEACKDFIKSIYELYEEI